MCKLGIVKMPHQEAQNEPHKDARAQIYDVVKNPKGKDQDNLRRRRWIYHQDWPPEPPAGFP